MNTRAPDELLCPIPVVITTPTHPDDFDCALPFTGASDMTTISPAAKHLKYCIELDPLEPVHVRARRQNRAELSQGCLAGTDGGEVVLVDDRILR